MTYTYRYDRSKKRIDYAVRYMLGNSIYYGLIEDFISSSTAAVCKLSKLEKMAPHITIVNTPWYIMLIVVV